MTEQEFLDLISSKSARQVLDAMSKIPPKERRGFAKPAMRLFKQIDQHLMHDSKTPMPRITDNEAAVVAVLATASQSELTKLSMFPVLRGIPLEEVVGKLEPDWTQAVVEHFIEIRTFYVDRFKPLWRAGLCECPQSDAIILNYYSHWVGTRTNDDEEDLLAGDVWRFFEVEGGGEDSLANHDKYIKLGTESWADRLKRYSDTGKLDRQRLLDASLDALSRDFAQYRAGWYSRFHTMMAPNANEMEVRSDRYMRLLSSSIPPTVSFAIKHVQKLEKSGAIEPGKLVDALEPALQARAKGTVSAALKLLASAANKQSELAPIVAKKVVLALISEDAGVQEKALDIIEALGHETVSTQLAEYVELVSPSLRKRIAALAGVSAESGAEADLANISPNETVPITPLASAGDALALFLKVLEEPRNPVEVECAIDGISRFGVALRKDEKSLSPLRKRTEQVSKSLFRIDIRYVLAITGYALATGESIKAICRNESRDGKALEYYSEASLQFHHLARNEGVVERVLAGVSLPLLSLPSSNSGMVSVVNLLERMEVYRQAGVEPEHHDLALALMRLSPDNRNIGEIPLDTEAERALAYALGENVKVGPSEELWAAAWRARIPERADESITKFFKDPDRKQRGRVPDCGIPAKMELVVERQQSEDGEYAWINVKVPVEPANELQTRALPALFCLTKQRYMDAIICGSTFADIAWASLIRPADCEPFFRNALIHQDTWQKLSDNHTRAYLEPFFRPGPQVGPLGAGVLAYYMACEDKSVVSLAVEAVVVLLAEGRLTQEVFTSALKKFLMSDSLPTGRWTKALSGVAELGAGSFVRDVIVGLLDFSPDRTPRDVGGLLELCFELHVAQNAKLSDPAAIKCLQSIPGGGKVARYSRELLALANSEKD